MVELIVLAIIGWIVYQVVFKAGKREGSRKGYGVGLKRKRRPPRRRRR